SIAGTRDSAVKSQTQGNPAFRSIQFVLLSCLAPVSGPAWVSHGFLRLLAVLYVNIRQHTDGRCLGEAVRHIADAVVEQNISYIAAIRTSIPILSECVRNDGYCSTGIGRIWGHIDTHDINEQSGLRSRIPGCKRIGG